MGDSDAAGFDDLYEARTKVGTGIPVCAEPRLFLGADKNVCATLKVNASNFTGSQSRPSEKDTLWRNNEDRLLEMP
jgi:hypothetical protein